MIIKLLYSLVSSIKSTVLHKPLAFVVLFSVIMISTVICGIPMKLFVWQIEEDLATYSLGVTQDYSKMLAVAEYGDVILSMYDNGAFDKKKVCAEVKTYVSDIKVKSVAESAIVIQEITPNYFERENLSAGAEQIVISKYLTEIWSIKKGEQIEIFGKQLVVCAEVAANNYYSDTNYIVVPYSLDIYDYINDRYNKKIDHEPIFSNQQIGKVDLIKNPSVQEKDSLIKIDGLLQSKKAINFPLIQMAILLGIILGICLISIVLCYNYYLKLSERKFAIYKTLGASPMHIAAVMTAENIAITSFAAAIGVLIDYVLIGIRGSYMLTQLKWLHHLLLFILTFLTVSVIGLIKIIQRAKRMPIDKRMG